MRRLGRAAAVLVLAAALAVGAGCTGTEEPKLEPKVAPPATKSAGVLTAGVDLSTPPFAGVDQGRRAGIDVDAAAALANQLGLTVSYVDVKPSDAATALASGRVDVVFSVPIDASDLSQISLAGTYITDAPAFFVATDSTQSVEPSLTLDTITEPVIAAQRESAAYWILLHELDQDAIEPFDSLRDGMQALSDGEVKLLAGDAIVGAYIARDFPTVHYAGRLGAASPLAVAVAADNTALGDSVREALDGLAADGVLDTIRRKWVGDLPAIAVEGSDEVTGTP